MAEVRGVHRVALVLQSTSSGGMETHAIDLAAEYVLRGMDVLVFVPLDAALDEVASRFAANGALVVRLNTDGRSGRLHQAASVVRYTRSLRSFAPNIVHVHTGGATGGLAAVAIARAVTHATVGITEHDVPGVRPSRGQQLGRALVDRSAHAVVAVSRRNARIRDARLRVRNNGFYVVLNGVPIPAGTTDPGDVAAVRAKHGLRTGDVVLGSLVRLAEGKGLDTLLDAFAILRRDVPCKLLLVGDGPLRQVLAARAEATGFGEDIVFAGRQSPPAPYLDAMDVFVLPVPAGSMSIALLEAMARGLPPLITFGGPEEAVINGQTGLVAPPSDPPALAAMLRLLVEDSSLRGRLADAAARHVRRNYSVERVADDLLELFSAAGDGWVVERLHASGPPDPRPGEHAPTSKMGGSQAPARERQAS